jgi:eukaryotic-like serine/threonine-protein kinase
MSEEHRRRLHIVQEILAELLDAAPAEREALIAQRCAGRDELIDDVRSLLAAADGADAYFERVSRDAGAPLGRRGGGDDAAVGRMFGPYRLDRLIGVGGMGAVYRAERADDLYRMRVAVKLLPPGFATEGMRRRFTAERRILARLQHPGIAALLDGGVSEDGVPFFVMEYVDGLPIDCFCDERGLATDARLRLFQQVCSAVEYAHRNLVVHRDLKPSNILVTADGEVKLLDFGVAVLLENDADAGDNPLTELHGRPFTPAYASPEQIRGEALTTAADVYSLGVLLYQLLAGRRPYEVTGLPPLRVEQVVCEELPPAPSEAVTTLEPVTARADRVGLSRRLRGDLDTIVMTALQKDPARRYASVLTLAEDIERHLTARPVLARPDSFGYRASRFVARNRYFVGAGALVAVLLIGFAALATYTAVSAGARNALIAAERDRAQRETEKAEAVSSFLVGLFGSNDPDVAAGESQTAFQILEQGERNAAELASQPAVHARVLDVVAQVYTRLGEYERAESLFRQAAALLRAEPGVNAGEIAAPLSRLGDLLRRRGQLDEAVALLDEAIGLAELAGDTILLANGLNDLGLARYDQGDFAEAERLHRRALELRSSAYGSRHNRTATSLQNLALAVAQLNRGSEAEALYREALVIYRETLGGEHTEVATTLTSLGRSLSERGEFEEAIPLLSEALRINRSRLGNGHPHVALVLNDLGSVRARQGRFEEAETIFRDALELREQALGASHPYVATSLNNLAFTMVQQGRLDDALPLRRRAYGMARERLGNDHVNTGQFAHNLADLLMRLNRLAEAEVLYRESIEILTRAFPEAHPLTARPLTGLADLLIRLGRRAEAAPFLRRTIDVLISTDGDPNEIARLEILLQR